MNLGMTNLDLTFSLDEFGYEDFGLIKSRIGCNWKYFPSISICEFFLLLFYIYFGKLHKAKMAS